MRTLTLLLFAVFATLTTGSSIADEVESEEIKDPQGVALSTIGHYDVGLDKASSRLPARVAEAVSSLSSVIESASGCPLTTIPVSLLNPLTQWTITRSSRKPISMWGNCGSSTRTLPLRLPRMDSFKV